MEKTGRRRKERDGRKKRGGKAKGKEEAARKWMRVSLEERVERGREEV